MDNNLEWGLSEHINSISESYKRLLVNPGCTIVRRSEKFSDGTIHHFMAELTYKIQPIKGKDLIPTNGCPFMYCDSNPECNNFCRYSKDAEIK